MTRCLGIVIWNQLRYLVRVMPPDTSHDAEWLSEAVTCPHPVGGACRWDCSHVVLEAAGDETWNVLCGASRCYLGRLDRGADLDLIIALTAATDGDAHRAATEADRKRRE